jgi:phosphoserine phosphatase
MDRPARERFGAVIFDCDATLSEITGIDELSRDQRASVEALTEAAMNGRLPLEQIYAKRLALAQPNREGVRQVGRLYVERLVPDAREVVAGLQQEGIEVRIISTGLLPAVQALADELRISAGRVAAVALCFGSDGAYHGFDSSSPLVTAGGKRRVVEQWSAELRPPIMLVGDGATDLEAKPAVDLFVAFAGVVARPAVMAAADVVIRQKTMAPVLALALDRAPEHEPARAIYHRGAALLEANHSE